MSDDAMKETCPKSSKNGQNFDVCHHGSTTVSKKSERQKNTSNNEIDFKKLDSMINFNFKADLYRDISRFGYRYVSEFVYDQYYNFGLGLCDVSRLANKSKCWSVKLMETWGFKRRNKGGSHVNNYLKIVNLIKEKRKMVSVLKRYADEKNWHDLALIDRGDAARKILEELDSE